MIGQIKIKNFKCFKNETVFPLSKLNLLTGINGRGKSTMLQALLLFRQSIEKDINTAKLYLNGTSLELGTFDDIKNSETSKKSNILIGITTEKETEFQKTDFYLQENMFDDLVADVEKICIFDKNEDKIIYPQKETSNHKWNSYYKPFNCIHYVSADRLGTLKYHDKLSIDEHFITVGSKGQFTINVLSRLEDKIIHDILYLGEDAKTLLQQTEEWLNYVFDGAKIQIKGKEKESSVLNILFNTKKTEKRYKPANVGFGYSYILPIIVSGLIAEKGDILIIENPEAHLHPKAQSRITEFFAKVASTGVQVFIESHSEHILNGIRISALKNNIAISNDEVSILYFGNSEQCQFVRLNIKTNGKIDNWVDGFFDQQENDLAKIFKLSISK
ncbi:MAG: DUF3696 domain-containing protein [Desulfobacteraceae bacterium]|nr:DUF3696 domain-containing protein [Desulfobacteraceae bacterium]